MPKKETKERLTPAEYQEYYRRQKETIGSIENTWLMENYFGISPYYKCATERKYDVGGYKISVDLRKGHQPFSSLKQDPFYDGRIGGAGPVDLFMAVGNIKGWDTTPSLAAKHPQRYNTGNAKRDNYMKGLHRLCEELYPHLLPPDQRPSEGKHKRPKEEPQLVDSTIRNAKDREEETPIKLPKESPSLLPKIREYMLSRKFHPALVEQALKTKAIYGGIREQEANGRHGPYIRKNPSLIVPAKGEESGKIVAYSFIDLNSSFRGNRGQMKNAFLTVGAYSEDTKRVVLTEAYFDSLAKAELERLRKDTVITSTAGSRTPEELLQKAAKKGWEIVCAQDSDTAGRNTAKRIEEIGSELGIKVTRDMVPGAVREIRFSSISPDSPQRVKSLGQTLEKNQINFSVSRLKEGKDRYYSVFMPSNEQTDRIMAEAMKQYQSEDKIHQDRFTQKYAELHGLNYTPKKPAKVVEESVYMKDWNDVLRFEKGIQQEPDKPAHEHVPGLPSHYVPFPYPEAQRWGLSGNLPKQDQEHVSKESAVEVEV